MNEERFQGGIYRDKRWFSVRRSYVTDDGFVVKDGFKKLLGSN
jgi:hypothetical protein